MADWDKKSPAFDFEKGEFMTFGRKIRCLRGQERVKQKAEKIIRTELGRYRIYEGMKYGVRLDDLIIGKAYTHDFVKAEVQREITEALLRDSEITSVDNFEVEITDSILKVTLYINTVFGVLEVSV